MSARLDTLLEAAAEALYDGRDPFSDAFLVEHAVTANECRDLSTTMAAAIGLYLSTRVLIDDLVQNARSRRRAVPS